MVDPRGSTAAVGVVGAGAAGLWVAGRAARLGLDVVLLEKTARTGTKILASGGTRCNLTTTLDARRAGDLFGPRAARFLRHGLRVLDPAAVRERFDELGVPTVEAPLEKVFPASDRARDVRDALEREARARGVHVVFDARVVSVRPEADLWCVELENGTTWRFARLVLCPGGKSYPRTGTTGDGYAWLEALDLPLVEPVPALVPLESPAAWVHELTGLSLQDTNVRLKDAGGRVIAKRARPVVFTHHGLSGPGAMDVSEAVARASGPLVLELDLLPALDREALRAVLIELAGAPGAQRLVRAARLGLPRRLLAAVLERAGLPLEARAQDLSKDARHRLIETLKALSVPVDGTLGYEKAEVTAGGLALEALDPSTMAVRGRSGLFVCGELLDLQGPIGGLNFQAAFTTAELVARALERA